MSNSDKISEDYPSCRKCGHLKMEPVDRNRRQLIEEVIETHYCCPNCKYELIIPKLIEK